MATGTRGQPTRNPALAALLNLPEIVASSLLVLMSIIVVMQVLFRYVLRSPISWSEELATFSFIWLASISAALGVKYQLHFALEVVAKRFPDGIQRVLQLVGAVAITGMLGILIWYGLSLVGLNTNQISPALRMPMSIPYLSVPVSCALMIVYLWSHLLRSLRGQEAILPTAEVRESSGA